MEPVVFFGREAMDGVSSNPTRGSAASARPRQRRPPRRTRGRRLHRSVASDQGAGRPGPRPVKGSEVASCSVVRESASRAARALRRRPGLLAPCRGTTAASSSVRRRRDATCPLSIEAWRLPAASCPPWIAIQSLRIASLAMRISSRSLSVFSRPLSIVLRNLQDPSRTLRIAIRKGTGRVAYATNRDSQRDGSRRVRCESRFAIYRTRLVRYESRFAKRRVASRALRVAVVRRTPEPERLRREVRWADQARVRGLRHIVPWPRRERAVPSASRTVSGT